ncbi:mucolipin-3-like [Rhopilema esculentum]|uniref:mucolipin-3-like n=1 Tax=Rhopilema esculentum TaxID=499914 RepID=UPI0031D85361|eukprot:gene4763-21066_t
MDENKGQDGVNGNRILKRLASIKISEQEKSQIYPKNGVPYVRYPSYESTAEIKPSVLENVRNLFKTWRDKTYRMRESQLRAKRQRQLLNEEQKMRHKLEYHFMTPFEKYKRGRKPWKLAIQILKIIIVTIQVSLFALDRFAFVTYFKHTEDAFHHLFVKGWSDNQFISFYSRQEFLDGINFVKARYENVKDLAIGAYAYPGSNHTFKPILYCTNYGKTNNSSAKDAREDNEAMQVCKRMDSNFTPSLLAFEKRYFERMESVELNFQLKSIYLAGLKLLRKSECFIFNISIKIDNTKHDGRLPVELTTEHDIWTDDCPRYKNDAKLVAGSLEAFDIFVILICAISCSLCIRSVVKSIKLAKKAKGYFKEYRDEVLTRWDMLQFINKWFIVIVISDCLSITGSFYKVLIDERDMDYYNPCSIVFGVAVLLVWIGLLRFLTYLKAYNILMITLRVATPNLLRFISCVIFIFIGFTFCGWIVLGPYHTKFRTMLLTMECLFSLLNGDDMYPTFTNVERSSGTAVLIFSKLYLYGFISFFIYVVLSTFIGIVGDTYERLKDLGRLPATRIERFIIGRHRDPIRRSIAHNSCRGCVRSAGHASGTSSPITISCLDESIEASLRSTLEDSQVSVESASLE